MKYCIIIPDGMADLAVKKLGGKTPLQVARTPAMDRASREGLLGLARTVPRRMPPGSDVAIMSVVGYDPAACYTGRGPLEAADMGIELGEDEWAFRCNLIATDGETLVDYCAGHITTPEADLLIRALNQELRSPRVRFYTGVGYRHQMTYRDEDDALALTTTPPHDVVGQPLVDVLPTGKGSGPILDLMERSTGVLEGHDVNRVRRDLEQNPANMIWLWGQGRPPLLEPFARKYGCKGAAISAVNLVRGLAKLIGWDIIDVPGATGYTDTDYAAKGRYAIGALAASDLVLVHVEAPDEASHEGNLQAKVRAIEQVDRHVVGPVIATAADWPELRVLVMPDHVTSLESGKHMRGPVPFLMWGAGVEARSGSDFTEELAAQTGVIFRKGHRLMGTFLGQ